jgi:hypothetical protein
MGGLMYVFEEYLASIAVLIALAIIIFGASLLVLLIQSGAAWLAAKSHGVARAVSTAPRSNWLPFRLFHSHHPPAQS